MDEEIREEFRKLTAIVEFNTHELHELKDQVGLNCNKLDTMDKKLDSIIEIVTANGQGIEVISARVDKIE